MSIPPTADDPGQSRLPDVFPTRTDLQDPLTGAVVPFLWLDRLQHALVRDTRTRVGIAVVALACQPTPDEDQPSDAAMLKELARLWQQSLRASDSVSRFGGGFLILLEGIASIVDATRVAERLVAVVPLAIPAASRARPLGVCAGVAFNRFCGTHATPRGLVAEAEYALARAQQRGSREVQAVGPHQHSQEPDAGSAGGAELV